MAIREKAVDAQPANARTRAGLADGLATYGWSLWKTGQAAEAAATYGRERAIRQRLADADPAHSDSRDRLANCETRMAAAHNAAGRLTEARACCDRAITIREDLVKGQPGNDRYHQGLAESRLRSGGVRRAAGDLVGAADDWRLAAALYASHPPQGGEAGDLPGLLPRLAGGARRCGGLRNLDRRGGGAGPGGDGYPRRAVAGGYRDLDLFRVESGLDSLRSRDDFRLLMMDQAIPAEPFARGD